MGTFIINLKGEEMSPLFFLAFFVFLFVSAIWFTIFEISIIKEVLELKNTKYVILLRVLEVMTPFVTLIIASGPRQILKIVFPVFCFLYIIILIIEFFRKKINIREFIVNCMLCFIDISLVIVSILLIFPI
jgi:hypothetical protein